MKSFVILALCSALCACGGGGRTVEQAQRQQEAAELVKEAEGLVNAQEILYTQLVAHPSGVPERIPFADAWNHNAERLTVIRTFTCFQFDFQTPEWQICMDVTMRYATRTTY